VRVLIDFHHDCLYESMALLCDRLGWELYRPIGMEWFAEGYWSHERKWHGDAVARQYLEPWGSDLWDGTNWTRLNAFHGRIHNLLPLEQAHDLRPDIVISSLAHNHEGFARFASEVGATFGLQVGNVRFSAADMAEDRWDLAAFGLVSALLPVTPPKPHVVYHQEFRIVDRFDGSPGFRYEPPPRGEFIVSSFVQCYPQDQPAYDYWQKAAEQAPELCWKVYGAYGEAQPDQYQAGNLDRCADVAQAMRASDVAWHAKRWSDGFGHVAHNWHAVGRPMFGFRNYYKDQLAGQLWIEGETAWDIETRTPAEVASLIRRFRDDEEFHLRACERSAARFAEVVNFDEEEGAIRAMFAQVLP